MALPLAVRLPNVSLALFIIYTLEVDVFREGGMFVGGLLELGVFSAL